MGQIEDVWLWISLPIKGMLFAGPFAISKNWLAQATAVSPQKEEEFKEYIYHIHSRILKSRPSFRESCFQEFE